MRRVIFGLVLLSSLCVPSTAFPCTARAGTSVTWIRDAEVILRVRALEQVGARRDGTLQQRPDLATVTGRAFATRIRFEVLEVLKGRQLSKVIEVEGMLTGGDDPNDRPVPYDFVRPGGRAGNCFAYRYRQGGEYLLMLRTVNAELTPYWATLGATNEQLFGADDRWLMWVIEQLGGRR